MKKPLSVWVWEAPTSLDPLDYDSFLHHVTFRSCFLTLVSNYHGSGPSAYLAKSWTVSRDFKRWKFELRDDLTFSDGTKIDARLVAKSFQRLSFLLGQRSSKSEIFDNLDGFSKPTSPQQSISGLTVYQNSIEFTFKYANTRALEVLGFGLYAIVNPKDYDEKSGLPFDKTSMSTAGPYRVLDWNNSKQEMVLGLRADFPTELRSQKAFQEIHFSWNPSLRKNADIVPGSSTSPIENKLFWGPLPANIFFLHLLSWNNPSSPFFDVQTRQRFRDFIYAALASDLHMIGVLPGAFIPTIIPGIKSNFVSENTTTRPSFGSDLNLVFRPTINLISNDLSGRLMTFFESNGIKIKNHGPIAFQNLMPYLHKSKNDMDVVAMFTGLLAEDPIHDVRFMFESKEGICLPDTNGKIKILLNAAQPNLALIDEELWNQAVIIPLAHFSFGLWTSDKVDLGEINITQPPTDFSWVSMK